MQKSLLWYINVAFEYILKDSALVSFIFHYTGQDIPQKLPFCVRLKKKEKSYGFGTSWFLFVGELYL